MLKVPSQFPNPGSYALLDGRQVRILAHRPGGDALVSLSKIGESITRTVPLSTLQRTAAEREITPRKRRSRRAAA